MAIPLAPQGRLKPHTALPAPPSFATSSRRTSLSSAPGVYDGLSARIAHEVGFLALYMTGAGTTASRLGMPDLAVAQLHDMREHAEMVGLDKDPTSLEHLVLTNQLPDR